MNKTLINREKDLRQLRELKNQDVIKVVTGIRRCGKSTLLEIFRLELLAAKIQETQIITINFEDPNNDHLRNWRALYDYVSAKSQEKGQVYVFLDEIQDVENFERAVNGLYLNKNIDLYITGSNSNMLSGELATLLTGRYIEIHLTPFLFSEYVQLADSKQEDLLLQDYLNFGGIPGAIPLYKVSTQSGDDYVRAVFETIFYRDIIARLQTRNQDGMERIFRFILDTIGSEMSVNKIVRTLKSENFSITNATVDSYLDAFIHSYIFYPVRRFNLRGREILRSLPKYYTCDLGFKRAVTSKPSSADIGHRLENAIYFELQNRYSRVCTGKIDQNEIDFVCEDSAGHMDFYQVAASVRDPKTFEREFSPLQKVKHSGRKTVITLDPETQIYEGIEKVGAVDWLLGREIRF